MVNIESIDEWRDYARMLSEMGYSRWQSQYNIDDPEGFHVWFGRNSDGHEVEVVTHSKAIHDAIIRFGS